MRRGASLSLLASLLAAAATGSDSGSAIRFDNVTPGSEIAFVLDQHPTPEKHMLETMAGGVAVFDYNSDGRPDIFFTNGAHTPSLVKNSPRFHNRLYRNDGDFRFTDVTDQAGVAGIGYSMGAAAADYDNDGQVDLFVAGAFQNLLYRNNGRGGFEERAAAAGIHSDLWSVAGGWFDYDQDGRLDLFVVNYVEWTPSYDRFCGDSARDLRVYCHPRYFQGLPNTLYRNRGDGTFENVTETSGIGAHRGRGMSVAFEDYDTDGLLDAFVSNDNLPNFLFRNRGDGTFEENALLTGAALREHGKPVASMGVDFRDYDNDGKPDIAVTALAGETFPLFRNDGAGFFRDATYSSSIARLSIKLSAWGNGFFDFDNDGWKDLFTANSHVNDRIELFEANEYKQPNSVFRNLGDGTFADVSPQAGPDFQQPRAHRGAAFADFDGDGRLDIVVTALGEPPVLLQNVGGAGNHWIILRLQGRRTNRDALGTLVRIGDQVNRMTSSVSYASSSHGGLHFGLGPTKVIPRIEIHWLGGSTQVLEDVAADQVLSVTEP